MINDQLDYGQIPIYLTLINDVCVGRRGTCTTSPLITISLNAFSIFYGCLASLIKLMFQKFNNLKPDKTLVLGIAPEFFY